MKVLVLALAFFCLVATAMAGGLYHYGGGFGGGFGGGHGGGYGGHGHGYGGHGGHGFGSSGLFFVKGPGGYGHGFHGLEAVKGPTYFVSTEQYVKKIHPGAAIVGKHYH